MAKPAEIITIDDNEETVRCDGGGVLGHPAIFLDLEGRPLVDCYYCGRRFIKQSYHDALTGKDTGEVKAAET